MTTQRASIRFLCRLFLALLLVVQASEAPAVALARLADPCCAVRPSVTPTERAHACCQEEAATGPVAPMAASRCSCAPAPVPAPVTPAPRVAAPLVIEHPAAPAGQPALAPVAVLAPASASKALFIFRTPASPPRALNLLHCVLLR